MTFCRTFLHLTIILVLLLLSHLNHGSPISFNFENFKGKTVRSETNPRGLNLISLQGDASIDDLGVIDVTATLSFVWDPSYSTGRAIYSEPIALWDNVTGIIGNFTTEFSFVIDTMGYNSTSCGSGFTFFLSSFPSIIPPASEGQSLALTSESSVRLGYRGSNSFVAVEFDTAGKGSWDPTYYHIGIDVNSIESVVYSNLSSKFVDGVGHKGKARVSYNGETQMLSVFLLDGNNKSSLTVPIISHVVDLRDVLPRVVSFGFSAATGYYSELHRIKSWSFKSTMNSVAEESQNRTTNTTMEFNKNSNNVARRNNTIWFIVSIVLVCVMMLIILLVVVWCIVAESKKRSEEKEDDDLEGRNGPKMFPYEKLQRATKNFAEEKELGKGGFGVVYKGVLNTGRSVLDVAIKKISENSKQGKKEYSSEVNIISRLSHRNLVKLLGWCQKENETKTKTEFLLVYEFLCNKSLDEHLFSATLTLLAWEKRFTIVQGLASALFYLHESCEECVLHRDIKCSNVMLDEWFEPKLGDFGLARLIEHGRSIKTTDIAGTRGYIAPECLQGKKANKESDVYAFGIVALEVVCGKRCTNTEYDGISLNQNVWEIYRSQNCMEVVDTRLEGEFVEEQVERVVGVGLWCSHPECNMRPSISQAIAVLNFGSPMPDLPPYPLNSSSNAMPDLSPHYSPNSSPTSNLLVNSTSAVKGDSSIVSM